MNHKVLAIAPIVAVAALALTAVGFAIPQQALAGGHHHNHNGNSLKVDQQINQLNNCTTSAYCVNLGVNSAHIHK
jgi:hypothetical protein